ncbi:MAG: sigma-70 family RNA polymerase sigma factor [Phycisphaerae bacterium]
MADVKDFQKIAMPHLDSVFRAALAKTRNRTTAEDLTQTTFAKALQRFDTYREGSNCKAWLMRILHNTWIDQLRHRKVVGPEVPVEEELIEQDEPVEPTSWSDASDMLENFSDEQVIRALGELPEDQRMTLFLIDVEGLSQEEVAEITDVPVGTVKSRTSRARSALKERLHEHAIDLGFMGRE